MGVLMDSKGKAISAKMAVCREQVPGGGPSGDARLHRDQQGQQEDPEQEGESGCTVNLADNLNVPHLFLWDTPIIQCLLTAFYPTLLAPITKFFPLPFNSPILASAN